MVGLYKDPEGQNVLRNSQSRDIPMASLGIKGTSQQQKSESNLSTEDTLRRRIMELETIVSRYSVCIAGKDLESYIYA